ncbi:family 1 encapsulin nanocompartment shell protein [Arthrobacter sp. GCM10027362]|uniref:family 1 encapsulin nanocompartment shell protein n=1 Tax=Arthrobacter sp. GCM10027362 TaxID=3273379 RepID=UPI00364301B2
MTANHLLRELAPISDAGWRLLDREARQRLSVALGARKLVDFNGPHGWEYSATNLGRTEQLPLNNGLVVAQRRVLPLVEVRADFTVSRRELEAYDRGAVYTDLDDLAEAALRIASAENVAVLHGWEEAGIPGVTQVSPHDPVPRVEDFVDYPKRVAKAVTVLLQAGIGEPFGLALGPGHYNAVMESTERGGYLLSEHLQRILHGPIVWAPGVRGAIVMSLRGGDFLFESGQDLSIGYSRHDADTVHLYLEQSFSFQVATPEAAIHLRGSEEQ